MDRLAFVTRIDKITATRQFSCLPTSPTVTFVPDPRSANPSLSIPCHPRSKPQPALVPALPAPHTGVLLPACHRRSTEHEQQYGAAIDEFGARCPDEAGPPSVPRSCARREAANPFNRTSKELRDPKCPTGSAKRSQYMCIRTYLPFQTAYYLIGHNFMEIKLRRQGVAFRKNDNAFLSVSDPKALQASADKLSASTIENRLNCWTWRLAPSSPKRTAQSST
jgi:hypothetical protein